jgi:apolipoprotein N-acyltransferase
MIVNSNKRFWGYVLFSLAIFCWITTAILPFIDFPSKGIVITIAIVSGEVLFVLALMILGKPFWQKIKDWFKDKFTDK